MRKSAVQQFYVLKLSQATLYEDAHKILESFWEHYGMWFSFGSQIYNMQQMTGANMQNKAREFENAVPTSLHMQQFLFFQLLLKFSNGELFPTQIPCLSTNRWADKTFFPPTPHTLQHEYTLAFS